MDPDLNWGLTGNQQLCGSGYVLRMRIHTMKNRYGIRVKAAWIEIQIGEIWIKNTDLDDKYYFDVFPVS